MKNRVKIYWLLFLAAVFFGLTTTADASLLLRQPSVELYLQQGKVTSGGIMLENASDSPLTVNVKLSAPVNESGQTVKRDCSGWIKLEENTVTVPARGIKDLRYRAAVPADAKGGYYARLIYSYGGGQIEGPSNVKLDLNMVIDAGIKISVLDTIKRNITVSKFDAAVKNGVLMISSKVKNTGNAYTDVRAEFLLLDKNGRTAGVLSAPVTSLYPDEDREIGYSGPVVQGKKPSRVIGIFDFDGEKPAVAEDRI